MGAILNLLIILLIVYLITRSVRKRRRRGGSTPGLVDPANGFGPDYRTGYLRDLSAYAVEPIRRKDAQIRARLRSKSTGGPPAENWYQILKTADFMAAMRYCAWRKGRDDAWIVAGLSQNPQWFLADLSQELLAGPRDNDMYQAVWLIKQVNDDPQAGLYVATVCATIVDPV